MQALTLFERMTMLSSQYSIDDMDVKKLLIESIARNVESMLQTQYGSSVVLPDYGSDEGSKMNYMLTNQSTQQTYLRTLAERVKKCDRRIASISMRLEQHLDKKSKTSVPFIEIHIFVNKELGTDEYGEPYTLSMALDLMGSVYRIKS